MENNYYVPAQIIENNLKGAVGKANLKLYKMIMMGFFAGMFIAIGAEDQTLRCIRWTISDLRRLLQDAYSL